MWSRSPSPPNNARAQWPPFRRRLCLFVCALLISAGQMLLLHRHLFNFGWLSSTTIAPLLSSNMSESRTDDAIQRPNGAEWSFDMRGTTLPTSRRLPDCLIIGVRKGGTRALLDALALHPRVQVARHEVHFFDHAEHFRQGPNWYRAQMPEARLDQVIIEKTPAYFTHPLVPQRVRALNPDMKLVLIVRDPVARTISDFTQIRQNKLERHKAPLDFQRASFTNTSASSNSTCPVLNTRFKPVRNSLYADHLGRWLRHFPLAQLLVLDGDKFVRDPLSQIRLAERFLAIGEGGVRANQLVYSARKRFYCFRRSRDAPVHCLGRTKGRAEQVHVSAQFRARLAAELAPHNKRFFAQLNRVFPWNNEDGAGFGSGNASVPDPEADADWIRKRTCINRMTVPESARC